jgi:hypothetical protein
VEPTEPAPMIAMRLPAAIVDIFHGGNCVILVRLYMVPVVPNL